MSLAATTELEAINRILTIIGESPIPSLDTTGLEDAALAKQVLHDTSRTVQTRGWHFNTEIDYPLVPDGNGEIYLPNNTLQVDTVYPDDSKDLVQRGTRLYDRENHTYVIGATIKTRLIKFLAFDEIPEAARNYIVIRAGRQFAERSLGSADVVGFTEDDEFEAKTILEEAEAETADYNIFQNYDVYRVIER